MQLKKSDKSLKKAKFKNNGRYKTKNPDSSPAKKLGEELPGLPCKDNKTMNNKAIVDRIISKDRIQPYLTHHRDNLDNAIDHYKSNIVISESFYPLLSILEVGLRNSIDFQLSNRFGDINWYENKDFIKISSRFQIERISEARSNIQAAKKDITTGRVISELTFGFWTSLFDTKFELTLWKHLRLAFPNCPKQLRKRKTIASKLNLIRKFRNRIFHHESISWNLIALDTYKNDIIEVISWLNQDLIEWLGDLNHVEKVIFQEKNKISKK